MPISKLKNISLRVNSTQEFSGVYTSVANDNTQVATFGDDLILISVVNSVY